MAAPKPRYTPSPRVWNEFQVASRLNHGLEWFRKNRSELEGKDGFPGKDNRLGGWDSKAIELWLDRRSGLDLPANNAEGELLRVIRARAS